MLVKSQFYTVKSSSINHHLVFLHVSSAFESWLSNCGGFEPDTLNMCLFGGFLNGGTSFIIHFVRISHYKPAIGGYGKTHVMYVPSTRVSGSTLLLPRCPSLAVGCSHGMSVVKRERDGRKRKRQPSPASGWARQQVWPYQWYQWWV